MALIVQEPQLRYTSEQTAIVETLVEFPGARPEDPTERLKVVGWGNMAQDIQQHYHTGDRVILEGRLGMTTLDRPEGFKEKRAELTVQRMHLLGTTAPAATPKGGKSKTTKAAAKASAPATPAPTASVEATSVDYDAIPF